MCIIHLQFILKQFYTDIFSGSIGNYSCEMNMSFNIVKISLEVSHSNTYFPEIMNFSSL